MNQEKKMPEWLQAKCEKLFLDSNDVQINLVNDSISFGFDQCFEILAPQIKVMKETLEYIAKKKGWEYDEEEDNFELNLSNIQLAIFVANKALKEVETME